MRHSRKVRMLFLALAVLLSVGLLPIAKLPTAAAAGTTVTSMAYYSANDGPVISKSGVGQASYGFVMPIFNGGAATWSDVADDVGVQVKVGGSWVDIDSVGSFVYNQNWGNWNDGGLDGYWFIVSQTTELRLHSKANGVTLDYTLAFQNINETTITSMTPTQGPQITAGYTGGAGFTYPTFNNDPAIPYAAVADDLKLYVKPVNSGTWIDIDDNAASGWIYDSNFGQFTDGGGGYWFTVTESINVKLESKTSGASLVYTIVFNVPARNSYALTSYDGTTTFTADASGAIGFPLPKIDGSPAIGSELGKFVYQLNVDGQWVELGNSALSGFSYSGNGYNNMSDANQWGYWADYIYGLWFQPIQVDMQIRIGYPLDGQAGGSVGSNYVTYTFIGNPDAPRPDVADQGDITIGTPTDPAIDGYSLDWNDEFDGTALDMGKWNYETGYYISNDPNSWGWGNAELEHYTNSSQNVFVQNGALTLRALDDPATFPQDPSRVAPYSSGKINTKGHMSMQYGRVDIRAKLPTGNGIWPALWMLPVDSVYGAWAASGEIDIMEAKGRLPGTTSGAAHFGGQWPVNRYIVGEYHFPAGQTFASDYHVYSMVWEEDNIKWYVDGKFFHKVTRNQWYSVAAPNNPNAPFDQPFYLIMNLAVGGNFDGGLSPDASDIPASMQVDYVRVYEEGDNGSPGGNPGGDPGTDPGTDPGGNPGEPTLLVGDETRGLRQDADGGLTFFVNGATFADVHYKVNGGGQINVGMASDGSGGYTYPLDDLQQGDTVEFFFTYNPGQGALDTPWMSYTGDASPGTPQQPATFVIGDEVRGLKKTGDDLAFYVNGASFADLHYTVNGGGQINVAMNAGGDGSYTYPLNDLQQGDTIEYFFTYNPGQGALDTPWMTYVHGVTQGTPE